MGFPKVFCDAVGKRTNAGDIALAKPVPYPAKRTGHAVNQGGTADSVALAKQCAVFVLDR